MQKVKNYLGILQRQIFSLGILAVAGILFAQKAIAHHPFGGKTPDTFLSGFLSGLGHPVIGLDHFVFVIATGLLATLHPQGLLIPVSFCLTTMLGSSLHVSQVNLPAVEMVVSASVIAVGILLATKARLNWIIVAGISAIAGIFHGYAYGETIVGAEMSPIVAYLLGFTCIQMAIALSAFGIGKWVSQKFTQKAFTPLQFAGFFTIAIGAIFFSTSILP